MSKLATEEMTPCPKCGALTFEVGPCFRCSSKPPNRGANRTKILEAAKAFVHEPETWEMYQDLRTSISAAVPPELMLLCEAVEDVYGPPQFEGAA